MNTMTVDEFQNNLVNVLERVKQTQEVISINIEKGKNLILMDADDYNSILKTLHLSSNMVNAERLKEGIRQHRQGQRYEIDVETYVD